MHEAVKLHETEAVIAELCALLGRDNVITDRAEREFFAQDVYRSGQVPVAVIRPGTVDELSAALRSVAKAGLPVVPRGGGMSYTDGYLPKLPNSITVDLLRLERVVEVNVEDRYVTVECGATWKALNDALAPHGMRTPYWGPLSGLRSSIGGALAQNSIFLGSGRYGPVADCVLGMDVVLVDGSILRLGSHANRNGEPFFRQYGPDLMGVFLSDTGALGIKTRATFRLVPLSAENRHLSFAFETHEQLLGAIADVAREDVVSECFAFDPGMQKVRMKRTSLKDDVKKLGKVIQAAGGGLAGLKAGAKIVAAGRNFLEEVNFSAHFSFDGRNAADVEAKVAIARRAIGARGREIENSIPKVMRAEPFAEVNSMLGPAGERWVPVHGTVPFSGAIAMFEACEALFARHQEELERFDIDHGYLICTVGAAGTLLEPVMYWPDARQMFHERVLAPDYLAKLQRFPENLPARQAVMRIREELAQLFMERGAVSFQLGKFYRYQEGLEPTAAAFLRQIKTLVDPQGRMNPGSLGL
jgi:FAD/FMN-containing dehydrogenase